MFAVRRISTVAVCAASSALVISQAGKRKQSFSLCEEQKTLAVSPVQDTAITAPRWTNPTQNYVWTDEEIEKVLSEQPKYIPDTFWDHTTYKLVRFSYWFFNLISGYSYENPTTGR